MAVDLNNLAGHQVQLLAFKFWADVFVIPEDCWEWTGRKNEQDYGYLCALNHTLLAHRVAYFLSNGYWANPCTRHLCHNPSCVHPGHLVAGSHKDNAADRAARIAGISLLPGTDR